MENSEESKFSVKYLYNELWRCRDFEISHLWQRSVFLAVFMLAIAAAYGNLAVKILIPDTSNPSCTNSPLVQGALLGLCLLGIIFSMLWIMMAKGSKMYFEKFENSINHMVTLY